MKIARTSTITGIARAYGSGVREFMALPSRAAPPPPSATYLFEDDPSGEADYLDTGEGVEIALTRTKGLNDPSPERADGLFSVMSAAEWILERDPQGVSYFEP